MFARRPLLQVAVLPALWALLATDCTCGSKSGTGDGGTTNASGTGSSGTGATAGATSGGATGGVTGGSSSGTTGSPYGNQTTTSTVDVTDGGDGGGFGTGVVNLPDGGGISLGGGANFSSSFAYISNSAQSLGASFVSRVNTATGIEEARYPSVQPLDNTGVNLCSPKNPSSCIVDLDVTYYDNAPSRTVVDLNGGVFVANRGQCDWALCTADMGNTSYNPHNPDGLSATDLMVGAVQGSVTYIANRVDHPDQCAPRCQNRQGWNLPDGGPAIFSSGITIPGVGAIPPNEVLSPSPAGGSAATLSTYSPDVVSHVCLDNGAHDPTDVTDPTNYDDCARFTIPLGAPNGYDLKVQSNYTDRFAPRGIAISKNCGALGTELGCDLYVGLTEPAAESAQVIHLSFQNNFQVKDVVDSTLTNYGLYGAAIDCDGLLWAGHGSGVVSVDTNTEQLASSWKYNDGQGNITTATTITDTSSVNTCNIYGVAVDLEQHFWTGEIAGGAGACAFDYGTFANTANLHDGSLTQAAAQTEINALFHRYPVGHSVFSGAVTGGIAVDDQNIAYATLGSGLGAVAFNFAGTGPGCGVSGDANCLWVTPTGINTPLNSSWGIDLDQSGNPLVTERTAGIMGFDSATGTPLSLYQNPDSGMFGTVITGPGGAADIYTYSDFTGYALRHITQPAGVFIETFEACPPESIITWNTLNYSAYIPTGSDISFTIDSANDPAAFTNTGGSGPQLVGTWSCASAASCPSPATLTTLGNASYARVTVELKGPPCSVSGTPVLRSLDLAYTCIPTITQ